MSKPGCNLRALGRTFLKFIIRSKVYIFDATISKNEYWMPGAEWVVTKHQQNNIEGICGFLKVDIYKNTTVFLISIYLQSFSGLAHFSKLTQRCPRPLVAPKFPRVPQEGGLGQRWESVC